MLKTKGKKVALTFEASGLNKRQMQALKDMLKKGHVRDATSYLATFQGVKKKLTVDKHRIWGEDRLMMKKPATILTKFNRLLDLYSLHKPEDTKSRGHWLGVEIECLFDRSDWASYPEECCNCGADVDQDSGVCPTCDYEHDSYSNGQLKDTLTRELQEAGVKRASIKGDGSLSGGIGIEVAVLFRRDDYSNLEKVCDVLNKHNAFVNKTCGLHVHLDCRDLITDGRMDNLKANRRGRRIRNCLELFKHMVPESRRENSYCRLEMNDISGDGCRYAAVNMHAVGKFKTIEVRLHSGTTKFNKIKNWCELLMLTSRCSGFTNNTITTLDDYLVKQELSDEMKGYIASRVAKFNDDETFERVMGEAELPELTTNEEIVALADEAACAA
jgi:hypothetical protein